jgi:Tol biopolymer transport system component
MGRDRSGPPRVGVPLLLGTLLAVATAATVAAPLVAQHAEDKTSTAGLPLSPDRWVRFTTDRGSWMSVDVSPDGRTIVFDLLGDIYAVPMEGGAAIRLTEGIAHDMQPRFSPDGRTIAFVSDRSGGENVWLIGADGSDLRPLTRGANATFVSPIWTPDGAYVAVSRASTLTGLEKIWLYHIHGGAGIEMVGGAPNLRLLGPAMGPDQRYVWYAERTGAWTYNAVQPQYQLGVYDRRTGTRTPMTARHGGAFRPVVSPDGRWLAYGSRRDADTGLRIRDLETGEERWLRQRIQRDDQESVTSMDVLPGYAFTPDSRAIVISYDGGIWRVPMDGSSPTPVPFSANVQVGIGPEVRFEYPIDDSPTLTVRQIRDPVTSPDGTRLAFTALDRLYVMDLPDGAPKRVTRDEVGEHYPAWSPDGRHIAYVTWDDREGHLMRVASGGGRPARVSRMGAYYHEPAWSPDGTRIVVIRAAARDLRDAVGPLIGEGLGAEFVWFPAGGGEATVIGPTGRRIAPHFTEDADRVFSYGPVPAIGQPGTPGFVPATVALVSTRWDNTDLRQHLRVTWQWPALSGGAAPAAGAPGPWTVSSPDPRLPLVPAQSVRMAPTGDRALAGANGILYVITVPETGGAAPVVTVSIPDSAAVPVRRLTDIGGEFASWGSDGRTIHWSLGNAFFTYRIDRAEARGKGLRPYGEAGGESGAYRPEELRIAVEAPRDVPRGTIVLRGGRAITMDGDRIVEDADIVVRDNRITSVGPRGDVPAGARVLDMTGKTILPGFVDTHAHHWNIFGLHWSRPWTYLANLAYGVTTARDPQTSTTDVLTYADRVEAGQMPGPRIYTTGPGVFWETGIRSLDEARSILRRYSEYFDTKTFKMYLAGNRRQRQWWIIAGRELGLMPTAEGGLNYRLGITLAMDGYPGLEHSLPIVPLYNDVIELFTAAQTTNTPTLLTTFGGPWGENHFFTTEDVAGDAKLRHFIPPEELNPKIRRRNPGPGPGGWFHPDEYTFPTIAAWLRDLVVAGGRVGVGSHGQLQGLGYHWEMWALHSGGWDNHMLLRSATIMGAEALGLAGDLGSLEAGKLADLVVLHANPLDDIRNTNTVRYVMKNGRLYDASTLDELWPRQRKAPAEPWRQLVQGPSYTGPGAQ